MNRPPITKRQSIATLRAAFHRLTAGAAAIAAAYAIAAALATLAALLMAVF